MEFKEIEPIRGWKLIPGKDYLMEISGEWFVACFESEFGYLRHSCSGVRGMWDDYTQEQLQTKELLLRVLELPPDG